MPDYRRTLKAPFYTRLLGAARRERCFEPAFFEVLEPRLAELHAARTPLARLRVRAAFQLDALRLTLQTLQVVRAPETPESQEPPLRLGLPFFLSDLRMAARSLARSPGFAAVVAVTLALGIGANVAIFSVVDAVLLRSLPFPEPDRLVVGFAAEPKQDKDRSYFSIPAVRDYQTEARSFAALAGLSPTWSFTLRGEGGEPERVSGLYLSAGAFELLGVTPALGRSFLPPRTGPARRSWSS